MSFADENSVAASLTKLVGRERAERFPLLSRFDWREQEETAGVVPGNNGVRSLDAWLGVWVSTRQELHIRSDVVVACLARYDRIKSGPCLLLRLALKLFSVVVFPRCFRLRRVFLFDSLENKLSFHRLHSVFGFRFREVSGMELCGFYVKNNSGVTSETSALGNEGTEDGLSHGAERMGDAANSGWWDIDQGAEGATSARSSEDRGSRGRGLGGSTMLGPILTLWRIRHDQFFMRNKRGPLLGGARGEENPPQQCRVWTIQIEGGFGLVHEEKILSKDGGRFVELNFGLARDTGEVLWESVHEFVRFKGDIGPSDHVAGHEVAGGGGWASGWKNLWCCRRRRG